MNGRNQKVLMKTALLGKTEAGKSSLLSKLCNNTFSEAYKKTLGCDFNSVALKSVDNISVTLQVWDTEGCDQPLALMQLVLPTLLGSSKFVFICCDKSDADPVNSIDQCISIVQTKCPDASIFIIVTKADLATENDSLLEIKLRQIMEIAEDTKNCSYLGEISAKENTQSEIQGLFQKALNQHLERTQSLTASPNLKHSQKPVASPKLEEHLTSLEKFHAAHKVAYSKWYNFFGHTNVDPEAKTLIAVFENMDQHKSKRTKGIFKAFGWMDKKGKLVLDKAPADVIDAYEQVLASKSQKSSLVNNAKT